MTKIVSTIKSFSDYHALSPVPENDIARAEKRLSLAFAPEYRDYLLAFGAVAVNGHEIMGINEDADRLLLGLNVRELAAGPWRLSVVHMTIEKWELNPNVPRSMYVIENPAIDGIVIWQDVSGGIYKTSPGSPPKDIADSLADYIGVRSV